MQSAVILVSAACALPTLDEAATATVVAAIAERLVSAAQNDQRGTLDTSGLRHLGCRDTNMRRTVETRGIYRVARKRRLSAPAAR
jgi:hypothetical protein